MSAGERNHTQAEFDQVQDELATIVRSHFDALVRAGFDADQALTLTVSYQRQLLEEDGNDTKHGEPK